MNSMRSLLLPLLMAALTHVCGAQDASSKIRAEIGQIEQSLKSKPFQVPDLEPINGMVRESLKGSLDALDHQQLFLSLEKYDQASGLFRGARMVEEKSETVKAGLPAFEAEWGKASLQLAAMDRDAGARNWQNSPLALRALAEAAQGRSIPLLDGSRGFATSTKPQDGLFYMGQAQAEAEFAKLCASLQLAHKPVAFTLRSYLPELRTLQDKTNAAFQPPKSIDLHSRFIALNSAIKLAEELDARKFYAGSLYQYLEATRHFGMLEAPALDEAKQSALKNAVGAAQKKFNSASQDDSVAQIFLERAASQVAHPDGSAPSADEWRSAQVILDQVLPAYAAAQKAALPVERAGRKTVDITLVRWPYT